jgi:hypothetical protein
VRNVRWILPCVLPRVAACAFHDPDAEQIEREARARHADCVLIDAEPGEGDDDNVYMILEMQCAGGAMRQFEALYQRSGDRWIYRSEAEVDPASLHEVP